MTGNSRADRAGRIALAAVGLVVAVLVAYAANTVGWWWMTLVAGVVAGLVLGRWTAVLWAALVGVVAWAGALLIIAQDGSISRIAQVTGSLAGYGPHTGTLIIVATIALGGALAAVGAWLGNSVRSLVRSVHSTPAMAGAHPDSQQANRPVAPRISRPKRPIIARSVAKEVPHA